jgi:hypothetical protein
MSNTRIQGIFVLLVSDYLVDEWLFKMWHFTFINYWSKAAKWKIQVIQQ